MADRFLLVLWLTARCNLHCSYCYAAAGGPMGDMDFETARRAIDAFQGRPLKIQFAGGEPTLNYPLAEQICRYVRDRNLDAVFSLQTNGTMLTEEMVRSMKTWGISVGVSLDGIPEVNALTRGKTQQAVRGIRLLGEQGMTVGINAVVTGENVSSLPKLVDFALYLGNVGGIGLDLLRHAGRGQQVPDADPQMLKKAVIQMYRRTLEIQKRFGVTIELREVALARKRLAGMGDPNHYCYASCGRSVVLLPDGRLYPCGSLIDDQYAMGTCDRMDPDSFPKLITQQSSHCDDCPYQQICPRGCPSRKIRNHGDLECVLLQTAFCLAEGKDHEH